MKQIAITLLRAAGLEQYARRTKDSILVAARNLQCAAPYGFVRWQSLVPEKEFYQSCAEAVRLLSTFRGHQFGDYLEFGVCRGTSLAAMHRALDEAGLEKVRIFGFDSFQGLPPEAASESTSAFWRPGDFRSTLYATKRYLTRAGVRWGRTTLIKGWFKDTLTPATRARINKASLIMVDCDIYSASAECLEFSAPLIKDHAVIFLDDYNSSAKGTGQNKAFSDFLACHPDISTEPLPPYNSNSAVFLLKRN